MNVWGNIKGRKRAFLSLLCDGCPPYEACRKVWPLQKDVHGFVTTIFNDQEFKDTYARLMDYQNSKELLLRDCRKIAESPDSSPNEKLGAIKLAGQLRGFLAQTSLHPPRTLRDRKQPIENNQLLEKMAELGKKATNGHPQKPS